MGCSASKKGGNPLKKQVKGLVEKIRVLESEINEMMVGREKDSRAYEREMVYLTLKEEEMRRERKRLRKRLRKMLEEKEEIIKGSMMVGEKNECQQLVLAGNIMFVGQMEEERARRDEAAEKWKKLYLDIKTELDDLIQRTDQGERLYRKAEAEDMMEELQRQLKTKEEIIGILKGQLASIEKEECRREREVDILRQSLRIMSSNMASKVVTKGVSRTKHL